MLQSNINDIYIKMKKFKSELFHRISQTHLGELMAIEQVQNKTFWEPERNL
jgi:hypothetical protein